MKTEIEILFSNSGLETPDIYIFENDYVSNKNATFSEKNKELLGTEYYEQGSDAITRLMAEKGGFIRDAFHRNDIGDIALIWGDDNKGLCHIIKRRKQTKQPLGKLLHSMDEVIKNGKLTRGNNNEFLISYKGKVVVTMAHLFNNLLQFIVTAFYDNKAS